MIKDYFSKHKDFLCNTNRSDRLLRVGSDEYFIYIDLTKAKYSKDEPDIFWHIASIGEEEFGETGKNSDILLCANTYFASSCLAECKNPTNRLIDKRIPCEYRADSIKYLPMLINDCNAKKPNCCFWIKDENAFLRETIDFKDYVAIFKIGKTDYKGKKVLFLIGAFPIVLHSLKRKFDRDFLDYSRNK